MLGAQLMIIKNNAVFKKCTPFEKTTSWIIGFSSKKGKMERAKFKKEYKKIKNHKKSGA